MDFESQAVKHDKEFAQIMHKFILSLVNSPIGSKSLLPKELAPNNDKWEILEDIQMDIRDAEFMNINYSLPYNEALVLSSQPEGWILFHVKLY